MSETLVCNDHCWLVIEKSWTTVEIEGVCTKLMSWLKEGTPDFGMPVRAVFNTGRPTNTILDLAWVPA